jgi:hypothetical protein
MSYQAAFTGHSVSYIRASLDSYIYHNDDVSRDVTEDQVRQHSRKLTLVALAAVPPTQDFFSLSSCQ